MAMKALATGITKPYVSPQDPDYRKDGNHGSGATVFELGSIDGFTQARIRDRMATMRPKEESGEIEMAMSMNAAAYETCRFGLKGWTNFTDPAGKEVLFELEDTAIGSTPYRVVARSTLAQIPSDLAQELHREIMALNTVSKELEGKSDAA